MDRQEAARSRARELPASPVDEDENLVPSLGFRIDVTLDRIRTDLRLLNAHVRRLGDRIDTVQTQLGAKLDHDEFQRRVALLEELVRQNATAKTPWPEVIKLLAVILAAIVSALTGVKLAGF